MNFKRHARVVTADQRHVGQVKRLVIAPQSRQVTHIVVHQGLIPSGEEDRVVPVSAIDRANSHEVILRGTYESFEALPPYEQRLDWEQDATELRALRQTTTLPDFKLNIPNETVVVSGGTRVVSADDQPLGSVEAVQTDSVADRATYFVIANGWPRRDRRRVPAAWVQEIREDEVRLCVKAERVNALQTESGQRSAFLKREPTH